MIGNGDLIHLKNTVFPVIKLVNIAKAAMQQAYAPYSKFHVGAAIITLDGRTYSGCNIENASYGLTCCAERVAIFKAVSDGIKYFKALAVIADTQHYCTPCGACRQIIMEFNPEMEIYTANKNGEYKKHIAKELLPYTFRL